MLPDYDIQLIEDAPTADDDGPRKAGRKPAKAMVIISPRPQLVIENQDGDDQDAPA